MPLQGGHLCDLSSLFGVRPSERTARRQGNSFPNRTHITDLKRQVVQKYLAGETLHGLAKRYDISRSLIHIWLQKHDAGAFEDDAVAADAVEANEARIAALERLVGKQAMEIEFRKGALKHAPRPKSAIMSAVTDPAASASQKDAV